MSLVALLLLFLEIFLSGSAHKHILIGLGACSVTSVERYFLVTYLLLFVLSLVLGVLF